MYKIGMDKEALYDFAQKKLQDKVDFAQKKLQGKVDFAQKKFQDKIQPLLLKIRDALKEERAETSEMIATYQRFLQGEASDEEMKRANEQFKSFLKTMGFGVIVILPFSPITIPAIVKLGKKYDIDVLPNSLKNKV